MQVGKHYLIATVVVVAGCVPGEIVPVGGLGNLVTASSIEPATANGNSKVMNGDLSRAGDYALFELEGFAAGKSVRIEATNRSAPGSLLTIALFDQDMNLLRRGVVDTRIGMQHLFCADADAVFVGVIGANAFARGAFEIRLVEEADFGVPAPETQRVYLNFAETRGVGVQSRDPYDMPAFHGSLLGSAYSNDTAFIKDLIINQIRADYAGYDVEIYTSDDGVIPEEPYSAIHFGGYDSALLGLADNVDQYNENPSQDAVVYVETFAGFEYLEMYPEEIAMMIANVASHELGHLLGLYHTKDPADVMDTTATAWELTENQGFVRAALEPSVFPIGYENSPQLLAQIVGTRPLTEDDLKDRGTAKKIQVRSSVSNAIRAEIGHGCGTCTDECN